jgi:fibronectin-binding autotransporter adhesin
MDKRIRIAMVLGVTALGLALWLGMIGGWLHAAQAAPLAGTVPVTTTIQAAIDAAHDGDVVSIPSGTYTESLTVNKTLTLTGVSSATTIIQAVSGQRVITVTSGHNLRLENLTVTGGRAGSGGGGGVSVDNGSLIIVNCVIADNWASYGGGVFQGNAGRVDVAGSRIERNHSDNHGGGLYVNGDAALTNTLVLTNTATWDGGGLTVWTGRTDVRGGILAGNQAGRNGGGINLNNGISVSGTQFISNTAGQDGGGLLQWNSGQQVNVTNAHFERDWSSRDGGGLWTQGNVTVTTSLFISDTADSRSSTDTYGGGVYASGGALLIISSTFRANQVECSGCSFTYGGGVHVDTTQPVTVQGSLFEANDGWFGGGLHSAQAITIRGTTFQDNSAGYGGGAYLVNADIQNSDFLRNHAVNKGGGLEADGATSLVGARFISNTAAFGGGMYLPVAADARLVNNVIADNRASYNGSGLHAEAASLRSLHVTIARNAGGDRSGVCLATDWTGQYGSVAAMTNTILVSQTVGITATAGNTATLNGVLWYSNTANASGAGAIAVTNAITGTPAFAADGYHLTSLSKAVNAGIAAGVTTDIDGEPRDAAPDMGADEFRTCWVRLNNTSTDYGHVQAAVDASTLPADMVKVAGYCPGVQPRAGVTQTVYIPKSLTVRGGYTTTNWTTSDPTANVTTLDALGRSRVVYLTGGSGVLAALENLTLCGGLVNSEGGGIYDDGAQVTLANTIVRGNSVTSGHGGGGICVWNLGALTVTNSLLTENTASYGGGIFNNTAKLALINSTLSGNQSSTGNPASDGGGAIDQWGTSPSATIVNSTIVSNTAVAINVAKSGIWLESGMLTIQNSIVVGNNLTNNIKVEGSAIFTSQGYNLTNSSAGTPFTATTDLTNTNPLLGPLQNNGGSTWTHALLPSSPAIDRIPFGVNGCGTTITTDQRGQPRPGTFTHLCDIGAYEVQGIYYRVYLPLVIRQ